VTAPGPVQSSVLDRLIDRAPQEPADLPPTRDASVRALHAAVREHLEWLLNTHRPLEVPSEYERAHRSLLRYGLPDLATLAHQGVTRSRLAREIEEAIRLFEPRLAGVRVIPLERPPEADARPAMSLRSGMRFRIEARLRMEPTPERVVFDTLVSTPSTGGPTRGEPPRGEYLVRVGGGDGDA
jgi:type VI secretion system protein ImpF